MLIDGQPVAKTPIGYTQFQFTVPDLPGGSHTVQIRQTDGTTSNQATLAVVPWIDVSVGSLTDRINPGSTVTLSGSGFGPSAVITVNGSPASGVQAIGNTQLRFTLIRPSNLPSDPDGEPVTLQVLVPGVAASNEVTAVLDTVRIVVIGDSVMWGQGLMESQKASTLVKNTIQASVGNKGVYLERYAHSGAIIGARRPEALPPLNGEIPTAFPSILQQVDMASTTVDNTVDYVLMDGGINDVDVFVLLDPTSISDATLTQRIETNCNQDMQTLLGCVSQRFPNAKIVVCGYYPIISEYTNRTLLHLLGAAMGLATWGSIPGAIVGGLVAEEFRQSVVRRAALFASQSHDALQRAVNAANTSGAAGRVVLAQPQIGPEHSALSPDPWIWGIAANGGPEDYQVAPDRCVACAQAPADRSTLFTCERASAGHPNPLGAQAFASAMLAVL